MISFEFNTYLLSFLAAALTNKLHQSVLIFDSLLFVNNTLNSILFKINSEHLQFYAIAKLNFTSSKQL